MKLPSLDSDDKRFFIAAIVVPLILWWVFTGRKKYGTKGMN